MIIGFEVAKADLESGVSWESEAHLFMNVLNVLDVLLLCLSGKKQFTIEINHGLWVADTE